jgi:hypothetical protein
VTVWGPGVAKNQSKVYAFLKKGVVAEIAVFPDNHTIADMGKGPDSCACAHHGTWVEKCFRMDHHIKGKKTAAQELKKEDR